MARTTKAMAQLWEELRGMGVEEGELPTARALEDWQSEGLIQTEWKGAGRGKGRVSRYRPGTAEKVIAILSILSQRRSFDWVRMVLFYRGFDVDFEELRRSYLRVLTSVPDSNELDAQDLDIAATSEARKHSHAGQRRLVRESGLDSGGAEPSGAVVASAIRNATQTLLGLSDAPLMEEDLAEMAVVYGVPLEVWSRLTQEEKESYEDKLNLRWLVSQTQEITETDLIQARDRLRSFLESIAMVEELEELFAPILPIAQIFSVDEPPPDT